LLPLVVDDDDEDRDGDDDVYDNDDNIGAFYARDGGVQLAVQLFGIVVCMGWSLLITTVRLC
jgi:hypothetical protein